MSAQTRRFIAVNNVLDDENGDAKAHTHTHKQQQQQQQQHRQMQKIIAYISLSSIHVSSRNCLLLVLCFALSLLTRSLSRSLSACLSFFFCVFSPFHSLISSFYTSFASSRGFFCRFLICFVLTSLCLAVFESISWKGLPNSSNERNTVHTHNRHTHTFSARVRWRKMAHWLLWVCLSPKNCVLLCVIQP